MTPTADLAHRLAALQGGFHAKRSVLTDDNVGRGMMLPEGWRLKYRVSGADLSAYLIALAHLAEEARALGCADLPNLKADCALLEIEGVVTLPSYPELPALPALDFRYTLFRDDALFAMQKFAGFADFDHADFLQGADFRNASFQVGANFRRVVFCEDVSFFCTMTYGHYLDCRDATFVGYADFEGTDCSCNLLFEGVKLLGGSEFS